MIHRLFDQHGWKLLTIVVAVLALTAAVFAHIVLAAQAQPWRQDGLPGSTVHAIALDNRFPGMLFAGTGDGVYRRDTSGVWRRVLRTESVWDVRVLPDGQTILAADQAGNVDISHDAAAHWSRNHVSADGAYAVTAQPGHSSQLLAGAGNGLYLSLDAGVHWRKQLKLPGAAGSAFAWEPGSATTVFAGAVAGAVGGATKVYVSHDAGIHWRIFGRQLGSRGGIMALAIPSTRLYAGTMGNLLWAIPMSGSIWQQAGNGLPANQHVSSIAGIPDHPDTLFVATLGVGVFRSDDAGRHWKSSADGLPSTDSQQLVLSVVYSPSQHTLYAGTLNGIYTWTHVANTGAIPR